jgi:hypothetical protein
MLIAVLTESLLTEVWLRTIKAQCESCGKEMQFVEGDVIFGEKWYHRYCAKQVGSLTLQENP